jgi:hypothetical protein
MKNIHELCFDFLHAEFAGLLPTEIDPSELTPQAIEAIQKWMPSYVMIPKLISYFADKLGVLELPNPDYIPMGMPSSFRTEAKIAEEIFDAVGPARPGSEEEGGGGGGSSTGAGAGVGAPPAMDLRPESPKDTSSEKIKLDVPILKSWLKQIYPNLEDTLKNMSHILSCRTKKDLIQTTPIPVASTVFHCYLDKEAAMASLALIKFLFSDTDSSLKKLSLSVATSSDEKNCFLISLTKEQNAKLQSLIATPRLYRTSQIGSAQNFLSDIAHHDHSPRHELRIGDHREYTIRPIPSAPRAAASGGNIYATKDGLGVFARGDKEPSYKKEFKYLYSKKCSLSLRTQRLEHSPYPNLIQSGPSIDPNDAHTSVHTIYDPHKATITRPYEKHSKEEAQAYLEAHASKTLFQDLPHLEQRAISGQKMTEVLGRIRWNMESSNWGIYHPFLAHKLWAIFLTSELKEKLKARELSLRHPWSDAYEVPIVLYLDNAMKQKLPQEYIFSDKSEYSKKMQISDIKKVEGLYKTEDSLKKIKAHTENIILLAFMPNPNEILELSMEETPILLFLIEKGFFDFADSLLKKVTLGGSPKNSEEYLQKLLAEGRPFQDKSLNFALTQASQERKTSIVAKLIECGARVEAPVPPKMNALETAIKKGYLDIVRLLSTTIKDDSPPELQAQKQSFLEYSIKKQKHPMVHALYGIPPLGGSSGVTESQASPPLAFNPLGNHQPMGSCAGNPYHWEDLPPLATPEGSPKAGNGTAASASPVMAGAGSGAGALPSPSLPIAGGGSSAGALPSPGLPMAGGGSSAGALPGPSLPIAGGGSGAGALPTPGPKITKQGASAAPLFYEKIMNAIIKKNLEELKELLENKAEIEKISSQLKIKEKIFLRLNFTTSTHMIDMDLFLALYAAMPIDLTSKIRTGGKGKTMLAPLFSAGKHEEIEKLFENLPVETKKKILNDFDENGKNPLHIAIEHRRVKVAKVILAFDPELINVKTQDGNESTVLHLSNAKRVRDYLESVASEDLKKAKDSEGRTYEDLDEASQSSPAGAGGAGGSSGGGGGSGGAAQAASAMSTPASASASPATAAAQPAAPVAAVPAPMAPAPAPMAPAPAAMPAAPATAGIPALLFAPTGASSALAAPAAASALAFSAPSITKEKEKGKGLKRSDGKSSAESAAKRRAGTSDDSSYSEASSEGSESD